MGKVTKAAKVIRREELDRGGEIVMVEGVESKEGLGKGILKRGCEVMETELDTEQANSKKGKRIYCGSGAQTVKVEKTNLNWSQMFK